MNPKEIVQLLEYTLKENRVDYESRVEEFGQVAASERRTRGKESSLRDHVRGLILAMLSNQRPWGFIANNLKRIDTIFYDYDPDRLEKGNYKELLTKIRAIQCGNRSIEKQLQSLAENIKTFRKISNRHGSMDNFITHKPIEEIAEILSKNNNPYKIKQLGFTLAMEYLRNMGIRGMKPDLHLLRICGHDRLGIFPKGTSPKEATLIFNRFAEEAEVNPVYLDNLFWMFGAKDYGNICSAQPKCHQCKLTTCCNYPHREITAGEGIR